MRMITNLCIPLFGGENPKNAMNTRDYPPAETLDKPLLDDSLGHKFTAIASSMMTRWGMTVNKRFRPQYEYDSWKKTASWRKYMTGMGFTKDKTYMDDC